MSNQTIDGVPRELLERLADNGYAQYLTKIDGEQLRALLAKPAELPKGEPVYMNREQFEAWVLGREHPTYGWLDKHWLTRGDNPENYADPYVQGLWVASQSLYTRPAEQPAQKYDDTLLPFMALMRKELHANAGKGDRPGWLSMSSDTCLLEIIYHFGKLQASVKRGDGDGMAEYGADVANMCMMLLDICGVLAFVEQPAPAAVVLPEPSCRQRLAAEGKPYPRSSCAVCGQFSPKWRECDALIEVARLNPPQQ